MNSTQVEYLDFKATTSAREYRLLVRRGPELHSVTVAIPNEAFLSGRVRYQDAPDICYLKIQRELEGGEEESVPAPSLQLTDEEIEEYRVAHAPKGPRRRS